MLLVHSILRTCGQRATGRRHGSEGLSSKKHFSCDRSSQPLDWEVCKLLFFGSFHLRISQPVRHYREVSI